METSVKLYFGIVSFPQRRLFENNRNVISKSAAADSTEKSDEESDFSSDQKSGSK